MADDPQIVRVLVASGPAIVTTVQRGAMGPEGTLGFVGAYSGAVPYSTNDVVRDQGSSWIALQETTGNAPPTLPTESNAYWELVAEKGDQGDQGDQGDAGPGVELQDNSGVLEWREEGSSDAWTELLDIASYVTAAEAAQTGAETAQAAAETAETNAETAETNAASSASAASTSASDASTFADNASTSASAASTSAGNAATSETNAADSASAAQTAQTNAETAETNAETAQGAAETARDAAQGYADAARKIALFFAFDDGTSDADPGAGAFRFNNATLSSATMLYIDLETVEAADVTDWIATWDDSNNTIRGELTFIDALDASIWAKFQITGSNTDVTGYRKVVLTYVDHAGTFVDGNEFSITFVRTGDKGADGTGNGEVNPTGTITSGNLAQFADGTGNVIEDAGVAVSDLATVSYADAADSAYYAAAIARANHTGTQTLSTISDAGSLAAKSTVNDADWSGTDLAVANGGTGASSASAARTNLGLGTLATLNEVAYANMASAAIASQSEVRSNTSSKLLNVTSAYSSQEWVNLTDATTIAFDMAAGVNRKVTLGGNRTLGQISNARAGQTFCIEVSQPGSTSTRTLSYHSSYVTPSAGITITTGNNVKTLLVGVVISVSGSTATKVFIGLAGEGWTA